MLGKGDALIFVNFQLRDGSVRTVSPAAIESIGEVDGYGALYLASGEVLVTSIMGAEQEGKAVCARDRLRMAVQNSIGTLERRREVQSGLREGLVIPGVGR